MEQPGNVDQFPRTAELSKLLECPVCSEIPFPPIGQCVNGHLICQHCQNKLTMCPECRSGFSKTRCHSIETIVNNSLFDCRHQVNGCTERLRGEVLQAHQTSCQYRNGSFRSLLFQALTAESSTAPSCSVTVSDSSMASSCSAAVAEPSAAPSCSVAVSQSSTAPSCSAAVAEPSAAPSCSVAVSQSSTAPSCSAAVAEPSAAPSCSVAVAGPSVSTASVGTEPIGGSHLWKSSSAAHPIPEGAVHAGMRNQRILYVARTPFRGGIYPGEVESNQEYGGEHCSVQIIFANHEHPIFDGFEVLTAEPGMLKWEDAKNGTIPEDAIPGGRSNSGEVLYIGRNKKRDHVGWVAPSLKMLSNKRYGLKQFQVLVKTDLGLAIERSLIEA